MTEALDIEQPEALLRYLRATGRIAREETPTLRVLRGGVSNRTILVQRADGEAWVIKQALAKLRVQEDWFSDPARIHREALGLRWLERVAPPGTITPFVFEDHEHHLLAMQAVPEPHENWKTLLLRGGLELGDIAQFGQLLGTIHDRAGGCRCEVRLMFDDRTFFETLRLEPYYRFTARRHPQTAAFFDALISETLGTRVTLVHGDFSPKNILVHQGRLVLIDHEVIHWGDPAFDLGFSFTHLLSKAHHRPAQRRDFLEAARWYWQSYRMHGGELARGADLEARAVRHTLACLLARVDGRSPLEYLTEEERHRQRQIVLGILPAPPARLADLFEVFGTALSR